MQGCKGLREVVKFSLHDFVNVNDLANVPEIVMLTLYVSIAVFQ